MGGQPNRVVIGGGGFAGLNAAKSLKRALVEVTVVGRRNHHLVQPLLDQIATGGNGLKSVFTRGGAKPVDGHGHVATFVSVDSYH